MCFDHPGFDPDLWVTSDVATLYSIWRQRQRMAEALHRGQVDVHGCWELTQAFARWFDGSGRVAATVTQDHEAGSAIAGQAPIG